MIRPIIILTRTDESDDMTEFEHVQYGVSFAIAPSAPRRYKQYTRNGKTFWRDYKRDVEGGITIFQKIEMKIAETKKVIIDAFSVNLYSSNKSGVDNA